MLTARFPLQGVLQALPITGREPDTQRSPHTTPPLELLTPVGRTVGSGGLAGGRPSQPSFFGLICLALLGKPHEAFSSNSEVVEETLAWEPRGLVSGPDLLWALSNSLLLSGLSFLTYTRQGLH